MELKTEQALLSLSLQAGFTLGIIILVVIGLLMLYCCYIVLKSRKAIRESRFWNFQMHESAWTASLLLTDEVVPAKSP